MLNYQRVNGKIIELYKWLILQHSIFEYQTVDLAKDAKTRVSIFPLTNLPHFSFTTNKSLVYG